MTRYCASLATVLMLVPAAGRGTEEGEKPAVEERQEASGDAALAEIEAFIQKQGVDTSKPGWKVKLSKPPKLRFDAKKRYTWHLETNQGPLVIELLPQVAPMHVSSTIYLTKLGFYDGVSFHRVITGFMAQGGDPLGKGTGGPGYEYDGEFDPKVKHDARGLLSMANRGPGTDGSQFFITFAPTPHLNGRHTIFGKVVGGKSTLDKLEKYGSAPGTPSTKLLIEKASIQVE